VRDQAAAAGQPLAHLGKGPRGSGHDFIVRYVAQVLGDVPAVPEGVVELAVPVAPERVLKRLADVRASRDGSSEDRVSVGDVEGEHDRRPADRGRGQHAHLGKLVREVQEAAADPKPYRHQPPVGQRDPIELLGAEGVPVEGSGALRALNDDVWSNGRWASVTTSPRALLNVLAACSLV
jgi:hypothetical protein